MKVIISESKIAKSKYPEFETSQYDSEDNMKDVRGRTVNYRRNETPDEVFQDRLDKELSGEADNDRSRELDDVWMDALRKHKDRSPVFAFVATAKKNK